MNISADNNLKNEMFKLFEQYYDDVTFNGFSKDLAEKTHCFILRNSKQKLIGFSTIFRRKEFLPDSGQYTALFSGDTVIHKDYWGTKALQKAFFFYILQSKIFSFNKPVYWFLQSKGHKTYLMMRKNFIASFPNYKTPTPVKAQVVLNSFYRQKYGDNFKSKSGLIQFENSLGAAKIDMCKPSKEASLDKDTQFFLERNPDYAKGDELACICEIRFRDFLGHIPKYFLKGLLPKKERRAQAPLKS